MFFDLVRTRHSIRKYLDIPVEAEKKDKILKAALMAPASKRNNPWEFVVIEDRDKLQKLAGSRPHGAQMLNDAPLAIVVIADTTKSDLWVEDASITSIIIQLQAHDLGLGSCWIQVRNRYKENNQTTENFIRELLDIPSNYAVLNIISIGYPNEERKPFDEEKLAFEKIHSDKF